MSGRKKSGGYDKVVMNLVTKPQDRYIPHGTVQKIMRKALVENPKAKMSTSSKELMQKCCTEFICFILITQESLERVESHKRKVLNGEDVLWAMGNLGFDVYTDHLRLLLKKYRERTKARLEEKKKEPKKIREEKDN